MPAKRDSSLHLNEPIGHAVVATCHLIHGTLEWGTGWSEEEGGEGMAGMLVAAWCELARREREMIWSCADSWDHNAWLPAAAWQIRKGTGTWYRATSPDSQHSFISFNYFKLGFRKQLRRGGETTCPRINSQRNAKWKLCYIFRCFVKGWQAFKRSCSLRG